MSDWDPTQYRKYSEARLRASLDLLLRVEVAAPRTVIDLGCGEGTATRLLRTRWPDATLIGVDRSEAMLRVAQQTIADVQWQCADLAEWRPAQPADVLYSNAALHWLPDHSTLLPRLMRILAPHGVLALQMPRNFDAPSHALIHEVALGGAWRDRLAPLVQPAPVAEPAYYYDVLAPLAQRVEIWETEYLHVLTGAHAVAEWTKGTWCRPFLDALADDGERAEFEAAYRARLAAAYPRRADGTTLFPFRRLFVVATARP